MAPARADHRQGVQLTDGEIEDRIVAREKMVAEAHEAEQRAKNRTKGGVLIGTVALVFAAWAGLVNDNTIMSFMGFLVSMVGFGISSPEQAREIISSFFGRGGGK